MRVCVKMRKMVVVWISGECSPSLSTSSRLPTFLLTNLRFRYLLHSITLISLTLLYTSLLPLLLHLIISIWSPLSSLSSSPTDLTTLSSNNNINLLSVPTIFYSIFPSHSLRVLEGLVCDLKEEGINEMWIGIHLLGGMSSGFGLRGEGGIHVTRVVKGRRLADCA